MYQREIFDCQQQAYYGHLTDQKQMCGYCIVINDQKLPLLDLDQTVLTHDHYPDYVVYRMKLLLSVFAEYLVHCRLYACLWRGNLSRIICAEPYLVRISSVACNHTIVDAQWKDASNDELWF